MEGKEVSDLLNFMIERRATLTLVRNEFKNTYPRPVRGSPWPKQGETWFSAGFKMGSDDPKLNLAPTTELGRAARNLGSQKKNLETRTRSRR